MSVYLYAVDVGVWGGQKKVLDCPEARIIGSCELLSVDAGTNLGFCRRAGSSPNHWSISLAL